MRALSYIAIVTALVGGLPFAASAQEIRLAHPGSYVEYYGNPKVAGTLLVGVRRSTRNGVFDPNGIRLHVDSSLWGRTLCVSIASRDALYFAENLYTIPVNAPSESSFEMPTKYSRDLVKYNVGDIAVIVRLVDSCNSMTDGEILPVLVLPAGSAQGSSGTLLSFDVNADPDRLVLELGRPGSPSIMANCIAAPGVRIAFTSTCSFNQVLHSPGLYTLTVNVRERTRVFPTTFKVRVPGA